MLFFEKSEGESLSKLSKSDGSEMLKFAFGGLGIKREKGAFMHPDQMNKRTNSA